MITTKQIARRQFLLGTSALAFSPLFGCERGRRSQTAKRQPLRVFVYAGAHEATMREVFVPRFQELTGADVSLMPGWWDGIPKLQAAPAAKPPFDLMITDATQGYPAARAGLFRQMDWSVIPNHRELAPATLDHWIFREGHGLPYPDSVMTLAYHQSITPSPTTWGDLLRPELFGQLGLYQHFYMSLYTFAAILADMKGQAGHAHRLIEMSIDEVFAFAREQRQGIKLWWPNSTDMLLALSRRTVLGGNMHSPEYLKALRENTELKAVVPPQDRAMVQVFWAIPAGTSNLDLSLQALNLLFSDEVQREFARRGMATSRPDTATAMAAEDPLWKSLYPHTAQQFKELRYYPYDTYASNWDELSDRWDRTVLREFA